MRKLISCPNPDHTDTNLSATLDTETKKVFCLTCSYTATLTDEELFPYL